MRIVSKPNLWRKGLFTLATAATLSLASQLSASSDVGIVDFKRCIEESKIGKRERDNFDDMRRHIESALEEKESKLQDFAQKFNDPDYVDGLSPEAEAKAKQEYGILSQEMAQLQQQYYQMMNQANYKVIQTVSEQVSEASKQVATEKKLKLILNQEVSFYYDTEALDITTDVVKAMDSAFEKENTESAPSLSQ